MNFKIKVKHKMHTNRNRLSEMTCSTFLMTAVVLVGLLHSSNVTATAPVSLNTLQFSTKLIGHVFRTFSKVSLIVCHDECLARVACKSYNYIRQTHTCELNTRDKKETPEHVNTVAGVVFNQKEDCSVKHLDNECDGCTSHEVCEKTGTLECKVEECQSPPPVMPNANMFGNRRNTGATVKYECQGNYVMMGHPVTECLADGNWKVPEFKCVHPNCWYPDNPHDANMTIVNVTNGTTDVMLYLTCSEGLQVRGSPVPCTNTGLYSYSQCCCEELDSAWIKVWRIKSYGKAGVLAFWQTSTYTDSTENCQFRVADVLDQWENLSISLVKVELITNNVVGAWLIFNATGSTISSWFSKSQLINTSWTDLNSTTYTWNFSIDGYAQRSADETRQVLGRFVIAQNMSAEDCTNDTGWMVAANRYFCVETGYPIILYSQGDTKVTQGANYSVADSMEIFVTFQ